MTPEIELVVLDMAGTTVRDGGLVERAFSVALESVGVPANSQEFARAHAFVRDTMGTSKIEVFRELFPGNESRAVTANAAFESSYQELAVAEAATIQGAEDAVRALRAAGLRVCLSTGFSATSRDALLERLGWRELADLVLCPADAGRGRPFPDMVLTAVLRLGVSDVRAVAVVGDTGYDMLAGRRAGASIVAGVLTGAHDKDTLTTHGATHVLGSVAELPALLGVR